MIGYKLFRQRKDGTLGSLFIGKKVRYLASRWYASASIPTKGYAFRDRFHLLKAPSAPHLSLKGRKWFKCQMRGVEELKRPDSQGGLWYLAQEIYIIEEVQNAILDR